MAQIQILILSGPQQDQRLELQGQTLTFGRQPENDLTVTGSYVSRQHGMLVFENGTWYLHNRSPNGTLLNGKRVGKKPRPLRDQDVIRVGEDPLFQVHLSADLSSSEEGDSDTPTADIPNAGGLSKRAKIWIGISIYMFLILGLFIYLGTISQKAETTIAEARELTQSQIARAIRQPVKVPQTDERAAQTYLAQANELFHRQEVAFDGLYRAYHAYQLALAYSGKRFFQNGLDQRRFDALQARLIEEVSRRYTQAYERTRSREYQAAEQLFRRLNTYYPDPRSLIFKNVEDQRRYILQKIRQAKR